MEHKFLFLLQRYWIGINWGGFHSPRSRHNQSKITIKGIKRNKNKNSKKSIHNLRKMVPRRRTYVSLSIKALSHCEQQRKTSGCMTNQLSRKQGSSMDIKIMLTPNMIDNNILNDSSNLMSQPITRTKVTNPIELILCEHAPHKSMSPQTT